MRIALIKQLRRSGIFVATAATGSSPSPPLEERVGERTPGTTFPLCAHEPRDAGSSPSPPQGAADEVSVKNSPVGAGERRPFFPKSGSRFMWRRLPFREH
jgi:hypothetical protein